MKKTSLALTLATAIAFSGLSGCASFKAFVSAENAKVAAWWAKPATQAGVTIALAATEKALFSFGLNVATQEISGEKIDWTAAGLSAGSAAVRQLELTASASSTTAIAKNVLTVVEDPTQAKAIAKVVIASVNEATSNGADASGALEGVAQGLDTAAATVKATTAN